ncbi:MAG TPA: prolyl oligopeptidase family serine peptidase [Steroidobacteraceae bacterium]|nr:prolyl oligopeptidase family serine peptidase [Steroidobacteraceae bacterium]
MPHRTSTLLGSLLLLVGTVSAGVPCRAQQPAQFTLTQVLSYPFPSDLVSLRSGSAFAWVSDERGVRNIWLAQGPDYRARRLTNYSGDSGQEMTYLQFSRDGKYIVYVRGGDHDGNWPEAIEPDPAADPQQPQMQVWAIAVSGGTPQALGEGDAPVVSPDSRRVAFIHMPEESVWQATLDGSSNAKRLFFDLGKNSDLQWSPHGKSLAFVSDRDDHSFIGVYRDSNTPIEYLLPSTSKDVEPHWSPDGGRIAFVRTPGSGGPPQSFLQWNPVQWSIRVADVTRNAGARIWQSPNTLRGSYPENGSNLHWAAGNHVVFVSESDNWPHLYTVSATGGKARLLTPGRFMVEDVAMTPDRRYLIYNANAGSTPGDEDRRHLYRVSVEGGSPVAITRGTSSAWSPVTTGNGATLAFIDAGPKQPPEVKWGSLAGDSWHSAGGDVLPAEFPTNELVVPKAVTFRAPDGLAIEGQLFAARGGMARKPGIIFVHGGPPRQMLLTWHNMGYYSNSYAVNQYLANHGFVVLSVNYRLGIGYGHDFHYPERWGPTGAAEYQDVLAGAKWLQHDPEVDPKRLGIWGGSYGGYLTALALARNSDIFKAGVDLHGVHDWSMFSDDWLGKQPERYQMPDMAALKKIFWLSSPDSAIGTWKSPVLLIQGDDDRNVHFHQMVDLVRRLQLQHVPYEEMVIPDEIHGFLRYHSWVQADEATAAFFDKKLLRAH